MTQQFRLLPIALAIASISAPAALYAADAASKPAAKADSELMIEEVVVTARKREENIQSVPVAITALSAEALHANAVVTLEDLRFHAPSLQISPSPFGSAVPGISIRGQRQLEGLISLDPAVGVYFADVVMERPHGTNASMYDLESVQVLKGPQGTLFGRNTTGGAVLISPNKPSFDGVGGNISFTLGNYNTTGLSGEYNLPISDTVALRFAMQLNKHDGYTKNLYNNSRMDDADDQSYRLSVTVKPTTDIESTTVYQYYKHKSKGAGARLTGVNPTGTIALGAVGGGPALVTAMQNSLAMYKNLPWHTVLNDQLKGEDVETNHLSNTTTWQLNDGLTLKNIIGWHTVGSFAAFDYDGTANVLGLTAAAGNGLPQAPVTVFNSQNNLDVHQFSEEFQVLGKALDNRLDWITGLYYFREMGNDIQRSDLFGRRINDGTGENKSKSVFGQATYKFESVKDLSLTAGWRKTWDDRAIDQHQMLMALTGTQFNCRLTGPSGALNPCARHRTYEDAAPSWGVTLDYQLAPDTMAYIARRKGYRSGGVQLRANAFTEPAYFAPETVMDWELGLKSTFKLGGMPVRTNAAVYTQQYKNMQRTVSIQTSTGALVTTVFSAGEAEIKGGELELTMLPTDNLELGAFASLTDGKYKTYTQKNANGRNGGFDDLSASKLSMIPRNVYGLSARYKLPLSSDIGKVSAKVNWYRQSAMQITDINNNATNPIPWPGEGTIDGYHLADAFIDWNDMMGSPFDLRFYVKNLTDEKYAVGGTTVISSGFSVVNLGAPRTYGFELRYRFGTEK